MAAELPQRLKQQLGAILEIAPNREVPMVKEAIENGFYRGGVSLLDAQKALLDFNDFKELETGLKTKDTYNPDDFNKVLNGLMNNRGALYERVKLAVWNNDLKYLDPTLPETPAGTSKGELIVPKPLAAEPPSPVLPLPAQRAAQQEKKAAPVKEAKRPPPATNKQEAPDQEESEQIQEEEQEQEQQGKNQPSRENQTRQITQAPQQEKINPLPQRSLRTGPQISKISRRGPSSSTQTRRNLLPRFSIPAPVRSAGLNMASGTRIAAKRGLGRGLGGLGKILGNIPDLLGGISGSPGGNVPPVGFGGGRIPGLPGRGGGGFFGSGRGGGVRSLAKKGIGRWLIVALIFLMLFAAIGGFFGGFGTDKGCPKNSVTLQKEVIGLTKASNFYVIENGQKINYTITAQGSCGQEFTIEDTLPSNVDLVAGSVTQGGIVKDRKITWRFSSLTSSKTVAYSVTPNDNTWVINQVKLGFSIAGGVSSPAGKIIDSQSQSLDQIFTAAGQNSNLPSALLKAVAKTEAPKVFDYNEEEFTRFSKPGWWDGLEANAGSLAANNPDVIRGYAYNTCAYRDDCAPGSDVRGVTQFEIKTWNGIAGNLKFADNHEPDRRNASDAIFGSAVLNRQNAESYVGSSNVEWTEDVVRAVARMYCAGPAAGTNPARARVSACGWNGSMGYDDFVWRDYQIYSGQQ